VEAAGDARGPADGLEFEAGEGVSLPGGGHCGVYPMYRYEKTARDWAVVVACKGRAEG
jgi:hypothetical protein